MSFQTILQKLRAGNLSVAEIESTLSEINIAEMEAASAKLEEDRRRVLVEGSDKDLEEIENRITRADRDIERAIAVKAELERRLEKAASAETENARKAKYRAAKTKAKQAADRVAKEYPGHAKGLADLIRVLAEATVAAQAANADLPAGAEPLPDPEFAVRGLPGLPRKVVSEEEVTCWYRVNAEEIVADVVAKKLDEMDRHGGRTGTLNVSGNEIWPGKYERRRFVRREYVEAEMMVRPDLPLHAIKLPGLTAGDMPFWDDFRTGDARSIVARMDTLANAKPVPREDQRQVKVEFIPVDQDADDADTVRAA